MQNDVNFRMNLFSHHRTRKAGKKLMVIFKSGNVYAAFYFHKFS